MVFFVVFLDSVWFEVVCGSSWVFCYSSFEQIRCLNQCFIWILPAFKRCFVDGVSRANYENVIGFYGVLICRC